MANDDSTIIEDGGNSYLTAKQWNESDDAREIHDWAKKFIQLLENATYLHSGDTTPLSPGGVIKIDDDGRKHHILIAEAGVLTLRGGRLRPTVSGPRRQQSAPPHGLHLGLHLYRATRCSYDSRRQSDCHGPDDGGHTADALTAVLLFRPQRRVRPDGGRG